jgi:hypothetical protein
VGPGVGAAAPLRTRSEVCGTLGRQGATSRSRRSARGRRR